MDSLHQCPEIVGDGTRECGNPITTQVSWRDPLDPDSGRRVVKNMCSSCADEAMKANWLQPTRRPIFGLGHESNSLDGVGQTMYDLATGEEDDDSASGPGWPLGGES